MARMSKAEKRSNQNSCTAFAEPANFNRPPSAASVA